MPTHWTYASVGPDSDLVQGDILVPTAELQKIFDAVHPHFCDSKYIGFLVTTQTCDMVRRNGSCSTKYINLAVIRQLEQVLHDFLSHVCRRVGEGVYLRESKVEANRFLSRLFNQNEQALGLFYLHDDADVGISVPAVAMLRVGISLRVDHYPTCLSARRGRLTSDFTAKLGWLMGNLFSRIGTRDWTEDQAGKIKLKQMITEQLDPQGLDSGPVWVNEELVNDAKSAGVVLDQLSKNELLIQLSGRQIKPAKDRAIDRIAEIVKAVMPDANEDQMKRICGRLKNDELFSNAIRRSLAEMPNE